VSVADWSSTEPLLRPWVRSISHRYYIPGQERADVEQWAWLHIARALRSYAPERGELIPFLKLAALRGVQTEVSNARRQLRFPLPMPMPTVGTEEEPESAFQKMLGSEDPGISELENDDVPDWLTRAGLTPLERECFEACAMGDESYHSAARRLDVSWRSVDNAIQRARRKLAAIVVLDRPEFAARRGVSAEIEVGMGQLAFPGWFALERRRGDLYAVRDGERRTQVRVMDARRVRFKFQRSEPVRVREEMKPAG